MAFSSIDDGFVAATGAMSGLELQDNDASLPIFVVEQVQLQFSVAADFIAAQVANNVLVIALSNGRILRIDLNRPEDIDGEIRDTAGVCCYWVLAAVLSVALANPICLYQTSTCPERRPR